MALQEKELRPLAASTYPSGVELSGVDDEQAPAHGVRNAEAPLEDRRHHCLARDNNHVAGFGARFAAGTSNSTAAVLMRASTTPAIWSGSSFSLG